jgi:hypothetical protein
MGDMHCPGAQQVDHVFRDRVQWNG